MILLLITMLSTLFLYNLTTFDRNYILSIYLWKSKNYYYHVGQSISCNCINVSAVQNGGTLD